MSLPPSNFKLKKGISLKPLILLAKNIYKTWKQYFKGEHIKKPATYDVRDTIYRIEDQFVFIFIGGETLKTGNVTFRHTEFREDLEKFVQIVRDIGFQNFPTAMFTDYERIKMTICGGGFSNQISFKFEFCLCETGECDHLYLDGINAILTDFPLEILHYIDSFAKCETDFVDI